MYCLEVFDLHKRYGKIHAVQGVSFKVKKGKCFGILGSNGAGKSTTIEILEGIKNPTKGRILYKGQLRDRNYKEKIGIQFQSTALQDYMTVREALHMFSSLYKRTTSISELIKVCQLEDILDQDHNKLSGGQRKRLLLALSLINDPDIIFLDEPTTGLDPAARRSFWHLVKEVQRKGKTIILTTHYMDEAYILCDEMIIIHHGKIVDEGQPHDLLVKYFQGTRVIVPLEYKDKVSQDMSFEEKDHAIEIRTSVLEEVLSQLSKEGIPTREIEVRPYNLDDLFLHLTGESVSMEKK